MLKVAVPEVTLYILPFSVPVPLVLDSVKPSGSDKEEGGKEAIELREDDRLLSSYSIFGGLTH